MPELPDLQVFSRNLDKQLSGKTLKKINIVNDSKLKSSAREIKKKLEGEKLKNVFRSGKELRFEFTGENILGMHLMLNGNLYFFEKENEHKNIIAELIFEDHTGLALADFQGAANITLNPVDKNSPDALDNEMNAAYLKQKLSKTKKAVKTVIMDQNIIRGIGNAYADEILWEAGIAPQSVSNKIPDDKIKALDKAIKSVLQDAEKQILKKKPDLITGEVRDFLKIHNARKKESPTGGKILHTTINSRKTYYTEEQVLYE